MREEVEEEVEGGGDLLSSEDALMDEADDLADPDELKASLIPL